MDKRFTPRISWLKQNTLFALIAAAVVGCGGSDSQTTTINKPSENVVALELSLVAGNIGGPGNLDGAGEYARFTGPGSGALDAAGNLFVVDGFKIRKIAPDGTTTTFAGSEVQGRTDGKGSSATFVRPTCIAIDTTGNLYVTDSGYYYLDPASATPNHVESIRKITPEGTVTTLAGGNAVSYGTQVDGKGTDARFASLYGIAVDGNADIFVRDSNKVRKISAGGMVSTIAEFLEGDGPLTDSANSMAVDSAGNIYAANSVSIWKIDPSRAVTRIFLPVGGPPFGEMVGLTLDSAGNLYSIQSLSSTPAGKIIKIDTASGAVTQMTTVSQTLGPWDRDSQLALPSGTLHIVADNQGGFYVSDSARHTVRRINALGSVTPLAGLERVIGNADGIGGAATFGTPVPSGQIAADTFGNLYMADRMNRSIRKITQAGAVTTLSGATFLSAVGIAVDSSGNIVVADISELSTVGRHLSNIRRISVSGVVTTLAGIPPSGDLSALGSTDGAGVEAKFNDPFAVTVDTAGNVYVADTGNNTIRKIAPDGVVTTLAGVVGQKGSVDGSGANARFGWLAAMTIDAAGNLYVVDTNFLGLGDVSGVIRKITPGGVVTTLAGRANKSGSADGTGANALFSNPMGITVDPAGNLYVADTGNNAIRRIAPNGKVRTIAGTPKSQGIRLDANAISLDHPTSVAFLAPNVLMIHSGASLLKLTLQ